jgi:molybdopterin molybdotransferase
MSLFLETVSVGEAIALVKDITPRTGTEQVPLAGAFGRVLSDDVRADLDIPSFSRSTVDGYAVRSADTTGATGSLPAMLRFGGSIRMGGGEPGEIGGGEGKYVPTGGALPAGADAVSMIEYCELLGDDLLVGRPVAPGENVVLTGEDFHAGETVLHAGRRLGPQDLGVIAAAGCIKVPVFRVPSIGIISTGNELVPAGQVPRAGEVRDANSYLCAGYVSRLGCRPVSFGIVPDEREALRAALNTAVSRCDAVLVSGGSSKDERDLTASLIGEAGEVFIHGIAIAPGKPTIIGRSGRVPIVGLPGHPASAFVVLIVIIRHLIMTLTGDTSSRTETADGILMTNVPSARGREEYVRVELTGGKVTPVFGKSGLLNTLVKSTGLIRIPAGQEGLEEGERVEVILW